jgi:hypothetical protein
MSFTHKHIDLTITLGTGQFGDTGANTVELKGLRMKAEIQDFAGPAMAQTQLVVFGLPLTVMNQLTTLGAVNAAVGGKNAVQIAIRDGAASPTTVYTGNIWKAWADFNQQPDAALNIMAVSGLTLSLKPVPAISYPGSADVGTIMQSIATTSGLAFQNYGVSVQLSNPYFSGAALTQIRECAQAAGINFTIDNGSLEIWPKNGSRTPTTMLPVISTETGMVGYPTFSSNEIILTTLYNPAIKVGTPIRVISTLQVASGYWNVQQVTHSLESETPDGQWFTNVLATPLDWKPLT